jgi:hypothetical protein
MKIDPNRTYTDQEKILITLLTIEEHLRFFKTIFLIAVVVTIIWFLVGLIL